MENVSNCASIFHDHFLSFTICNMDELFCILAFPVTVVFAENRELTQQDGWNTQDDRMTKKCRVRLGMHSVAPHFFVILPSCCVSSLLFTLGQDVQLSIQWFRDFVGLACQSNAWKFQMQGYLFPKTLESFTCFGFASCVPLPSSSFLVSRIFLTRPPIKKSFGQMLYKVKTNT